MQSVTQRDSARPGFPKRKDFQESGAELYAKASAPGSARLPRAGDRVSRSRTSFRIESPPRRREDLDSADGDYFYSRPMKLYAFAAVLGFWILSLPDGVSAERQSLDLRAGAAPPRSQEPRNSAASPETSRLEFYRAVASEMAGRVQFNRGGAAMLPDNRQPIWASPTGFLAQEVIADDGQGNDLFGFRVLVSGDVAFVSAPAPIYRPGSVYVFHRLNGVWTQTQKLVANPDVTPPPGWSDFFGWSLALSGDNLIIGAPFTFNTQGPTGAAFVFTSVNGVWEQSQELTASDAVAIDYFGQAVGLDGTTAVVGAYNKNGGEGAAYVFTDSGGAWSQTQEIFASDGLPGDSHQFGAALDFDGKAIIIGAPGPDYVSTDVYPIGAAYLFRNTTGTWSEVQRLTASDAAPGDQFGFAIDLSGKRALIGAPAANIGANPHQGAVYAFGRSDATLIETEKLMASDGVAYDQFGQSVALAGRTAVVGQWSHDDDFNHVPPPPKQGVSYVFRLGRGSWGETQEFTAGDGEPGDSFGWDVAVDGETFLIGAQGTVDGNMYQGSAYFFKRPTGN